MPTGALSAAAPPASRPVSLRSSLARSWPAWLMTIVVALAAAYAFSPRPVVVYTPHPLRPDQILVTGLAQSGTRIVAAGELGHILLSDDEGRSWREAHIVPDRGSTLTQLRFIDRNTALAVGHDGWILRSTDGGENWREVQFNKDRADPLMGLAQAGDRIFAFGSFGLFEVSQDQGRTWAPITSDVIADHHLYGLVQQGDGSLLLAGEQGFLARSTDAGQTWQALPSIYDGSFFGALALPANTSLVFGMRGHVFLSHDDGQTWQASELPTTVSIFGGRVLASGEVVLVGENRTVLVSQDGGAHFQLDRQGEHKTLDAVLALPGGGFITAGEGGIRVAGKDPGKDAGKLAGGRP